MLAYIALKQTIITNILNFKNVDFFCAPCTWTTIKRNSYSEHSMLLCILLTHPESGQDIYRKVAESHYIH